MQDLATKILNGSVVLYPAALRGRSDDEIVATLTETRTGPTARYLLPGGAVRLRIPTARFQMQTQVMTPGTRKDIPGA